VSWLPGWWATGDGTFGTEGSASKRQAGAASNGSAQQYGLLCALEGQATSQEIL